MFFLFFLCIFFGTKNPMHLLYRDSLDVHVRAMHTYVVLVVYPVCYMAVDTAESDCGLDVATGLNEARFYS